MTDLINEPCLILACVPKPLVSAARNIFYQRDDSMYDRLSKTEVLLKGTQARSAVTLCGMTSTVSFY